jgi:hypothetical protein
MLSAATVCAALTVLVPAPPTTARQAVERALPLLAQAAATHAEKKTCFACHNQAFPMAAFAAARRHGFAVSDELFDDQVEHIRDFLESNAQAFRSGRGTGGQVDTAGWAMFTLELAGQKPDAVTGAVVEYLLLKDKNRADGRWRTSSNRPPTEASAFTANYLAVRALKTWAAASQKERVAQRIAAARRWLAKTPAKDTEDRVYRLLALKAVEAEAALIRNAAKELADAQRPDGGWSQRDTLPSDAYATGTALVALHEAGGLRPEDAAYRRGVAFLLRTQRPDGSWFVQSRSRPFQPYYESGFPYKKNQFISVSATGWATAALARAGQPIKTR